MISDPFIGDLVRRVKYLEQQIDSLVKPEVGRWVDWTPTVDQNGAVTHTATYARCKLDNDEVIIRARLAITGSGSAGTRIEVGGLPYSVASVGGLNTLGDCVIDDNGTTTYEGGVVTADATTLLFRIDQGGGFIGASPSFGLASGDDISFTIQYERA